MFSKSICIHVVKNEVRGCNGQSFVACFLDPYAFMLYRMRFVAAMISPFLHVF